MINVFLIKTINTSIEQDIEENSVITRTKQFGNRFTH